MTKYMNSLMVGGIYSTPAFAILCAILVVTGGEGKFAEIATYIMFPVIIASIVIGWRSYMKFEREGKNKKGGIR